MQEMYRNSDNLSFYKTLSTGLWQLKIELDDGQRYTVFVGLK